METLYRKYGVDYETGIRQFSVVVGAWGAPGNGITANGPGISQLFIMTINNTGEYSADFASAPTAAIIAEDNATIGREVAKYLATDGDSIPVTYSLSGADAGYFTIDDSGSLKLKSVLDYEDSTHTAKNYSVVVTAKSTDDSAAISSAFVLTLTNVDDNAPAWTSAPTGRAVNETTGITSPVSRASAESLAIFSATDADGQTVTYGLAGADSWMFSIDSNGVLYRTNDVDHETSNHKFSVTVVAAGTVSNGVPSSLSRGSSLFILTINNVDEAPTVFNANPASAVVVENNTVGDVVAQFLAVDGDQVPVTYSLSGADAGYFTIDDSGNLKLKSELDFESTTHTAKNYSVVVIAKSTDASVAISSAFVLTVTNGDDHAPAWTSAPTGRAVNETTGITSPVSRASAESLAIFSATDADGQTVTYGLAGADSWMFSIDSNGVLYRTNDVDHETSNHKFSVTVVAAGTVSNGVPSSLSRGSSLFILTINNVNEHATVFATNPASAVVAENNVPGAVVARFSAVDGDQVPVTYSLSGGDANYFDINSNGALSLKSRLNYEDSVHIAKNYSVVVTARSTDGSAAISSAFVLSLGNLDDNGTVWSSTRPSGIAVDETVGITQLGLRASPEALASFKATDADGQTVTYGVVGNDSWMFNIDDNGVLYLINDIDYETSGDWSLTRRFSVTVVAAGTVSNGVPSLALPRIGSTFILTINNVNEHDTVFTANPASVALAENVASRTVVARFTAVDDDQARVTYSLSGRDATYFSINSSSGALIVISSTDYETAPADKYYSVVVTAKSADASAAISSAFVLSVVNTNDNATTIGAIHTSGVAVAKSGAVAGLSVAHFAFNDADGTGFEYSVWGADEAFFSMNSVGGLHIKTNLTGSTQEFYTIVVGGHGTSGGGGTGAAAAWVSQTFVFSLNTNAQLADHTAYIDGTTATHAVNVGGIIGHDDTGNIDYANVQFHGVNYTDKVITRNVEPDGLQLTTVDYVVRGISDLESLRLSFNGFTDTDGSKRNHWFFVQDDATDHSGHIVFDADGQQCEFTGFEQWRWFSNF